MSESKHAINIEIDIPLPEDLTKEDYKKRNALVKRALKGSSTEKVIKDIANHAVYEHLAGLPDPDTEAYENWLEQQ